MKKRTRCFALLILSLLLLCSCTAAKDSGADVLKVKSIDYNGLTELTAAEPDEAVIKKWSNSEANPFWDCECYLTVSGDQLVVSNDSAYETRFITHRTTNGYFLGVDVGEFDGWVKYFPHYSARQPEIVGPSRDVVNENCRGFVEESGNKVYLFTWKYAGLYSPGSGFIYELRLPDSKGEWEWEKVNEFPGRPWCFEYDRENRIIYIVSSFELLAFSIDDYSVTTLADLSLWGSANSMVRLNDKLYIGMAMGIYEYDLATAETKWYPIEYPRGYLRYLP